MLRLSYAQQPGSLGQILVLDHQGCQADEVQRDALPGPSTCNSRALSMNRAAAPARSCCSIARSPVW